MNIEMIRAAAARLEGHARQTPLLSSPFLDEIAGRRVFVKPECLQHTGSFKYRGGRSALSALDPETRARGVIAFSSGNHAQGVARAAAEFGVPSVIVMPADAPRLKIANTRALGAEVVLYDRATEDRDEIGARLAGERGLTLIKPFDEPLVIAGQGTCGLEIAAQAAEEGVHEAEVLVPCGGGGLASGIETNTRLSGSICDAIITPSLGKLTFPILSRLSGPGIVVSEEDCLRAMAEAFTRLKVVIEPGGAVALAAALYHSGEIGGEAVICVASGGNVDADLYRRALETYG
jgi:threonine dehydratase